MAEFPTLPLFTDAILGDTLHLNIAQFGAYIMLLIVAWRSKECALPSDDVFLARVCRMDKRTWSNNKETILGFFTLGSDAKLRQLRLIDERIYVEEQRNRNVEAGKASALKRKGRHQATVETKVQHKTNQPIAPPIAHTQLASLLKNEKGCARGDDELHSEEILPSHWQDYAENKRIPDEQIFKSWKKFKGTSAMPWRLSRWKAWIDGERIGYAKGAA